MGNLCEVAAMKSVYVRYFCRNIKSIFSVKIQSECKKKQKLHSLLSKEHAESIRKQMLFLFSFSKFCELSHFIYTTYILNAIHSVTIVPLFYKVIILPISLINN